MLNADQAYQQARLGQVQAEADRFTDTAALFQALGGGWWHRPDLVSAANAPLSRCSPSPSRSRWRFVARLLVVAATRARRGARPSPMSG